MSFTYEVRVISEGRDDLVASGRTLHAAVDRNGRPCRLPERIAEVFA
jgi:acyl-CoA thioesterase FadM